MRAVALLAALLAGCGRLGYDALDGDPTDARPGDAAVLDAAPAYDFCAELPALASAPVIDGALEPGLRLRPLEPLGWIGPAGGPPPGQRADYAAAWLPDGFYVYVEVVDPGRVPAAPGHFRCCGDGVELYLDADGSYANPPAYDDPGTRQMIVAAPADELGAVTGVEVWCPTCGDTTPTILAGAAFVTVPVPGGYTFEAQVAAADLGLSAWPSGAGDTLGFDLAVNVSAEAPTGDACIYDGSSAGSRLGAYFLQLSTTGPAYPFDNVRAFCTPALLP